MLLLIISNNMWCCLCIMGNMVIANIHNESAMTSKIETCQVLTKNEIIETQLWPMSRNSSDKTVYAKIWLEFSRLLATLTQRKISHLKGSIYISW